MNELVVVIDFGGQYNQLIARRVRECNVYCEILPYTTKLEKIKELVAAEDVKADLACRKAMDIVKETAVAGAKKKAAPKAAAADGEEKPAAKKTTKKAAKKAEDAE